MPLSTRFGPAPSARRCPIHSLNHLPPPALESDELTILTGWTQALAEALAYEPECVEALLADAQGNTPWRAMFGIPEPSPRLNQAISFVSQAVRAVALCGNLTLDALHISCREDRPLKILSRDWLAGCCNQRSNRPSHNRR